MAWDIAYAKLKARMDSELGMVAELTDVVQDLTLRVKTLEDKLDEVRAAVEQNSTNDLEYWVEQIRTKLDM